MKDRTTHHFRAALENLIAAENHLAERIASEIEFAGALAKLEGRTTGWAKLINKAKEIISEVGLAGKLGRLTKAVQQAEDVLAPIGKSAKKYTIHCVGHAHIDMNWQWSWPETVATTNDTFLTVLKLMEDFPDFCFTQSQAAVYEIIRKHNPAVFEQIKRRVAEGRWEIAAVHWVEGDKNLASGESLTRHLLYTRRFMKEHFGLAPEDVTLDWEPDTFGHALTIPTILSRGAVSRYYMCRGGVAEKPPVFWWQGPDGSRILVNLEVTWYNDHISPHNVQGLLAFCEKTGLKDWMLVYGVGDHGGGPTRRDIKFSHEMNSWPIYPNFRLATTGKYYEILEKQGDKLPVWDKELNFEFTGCYTSQSAIKKRNRLAEHQLEQAEAAAVLAYRALGSKYPAEMLRQGWIDTIFGHFHDILPGSGVQATREYHSGQFQKTVAATGIIKTNAFRAIAAEVDMSFAAGAETPDVPTIRQTRAMGAGVGRGTHDGGVSLAGHVDTSLRGFVVFNPTAWNRREVVQVSVWDSENDNIQNKAFVVRAANGKEAPAQRIDQGDYWGHRYVDLAVPVSIPAMGYSAFAIEEVENDLRKVVAGCEIALPENIAGAAKSSAAWYRSGENANVGGNGLENDFLAVEFDNLTGGIVKLVDKTTGRDLACGDNHAALLEYILEQPGSMSSWSIYDPRKRICPLELEFFKPESTGPHVASFAAQYKLNDSTISVTYALKAGQPWLDINISVNWLERGGPDIGIPSLRMQFPLALTDATGRYEIPYGSIKRDINDGREVPALRWVDVVGKSAGTNAVAGCALLNDCKYGHSLDGSTLRVTLIRSSYAPDPLPELGKHNIRLALAPHGSKLSVADLTRLGAGFNHPLQVVGTDIHKGRLPADGSDVVTCSPAGVLVTAVKKAEDEDAVIFRLLETDGKATTATVELDGSLMGKVAGAVEVDLMERPIAGSTAKVAANGFSVNLPGNGIASVKVTFEE